MALSDDDTEPFTGRSQFNLRIAVARDSVDTAGNQSKWDYSLRVNNPTRTKLTHTDDDGVYTITIEGTKLRDAAVPNGVFDFRDGDDYHNIYLGTTGWIKHDSNGNLTLNFAGTVSSAGIFGSSSPGGSMSADRIPMAPGAPTEVKLTEVTPTSMRVSFKAAPRGHANIDYYRVYWSTSPTFTTWERTDQNNLSRTISPLTPGTKYYVRVYAHNADGFGPHAPDVSNTTSATGLPKLVSVNSGPSGGTATLVMTPPSGVVAVTSYTISHRLLPSGPWTQVASGSAANTQTVGGLTPGATYEWRVTATLGTFVTNPSNTIIEEQERPVVTNPGGYFDGGFVDTADQRYDWLGAVNNSISTASGYGPTGWTAFATAASQSGGTGSVVRTPDPVLLPSGAFAGVRSAMATFTTDATAAGFTFGTSTGAGGRADILPERIYNGSVWVKVSRAQNLAAVLTWVDTAGALIDHSVGAAQEVPANTWTRLDVTSMSPESAEYAGIRVRDVAGSGWSLWRSGDVIVMDAAMISVGDELMPYFDGSFPDDGNYQYSWAGAANASVSVRSEYDPVEVDPLADPDCVVVPPPPRPPSIPDECIDEGGAWLRYWSEIPAVEVSDWLTVVPTFVLQTHNYVVRQVRIRVYANPFNFPIGVADTSDWCSEQIISYIPAETTFTLDGPIQRAFAEVQGRAALPADHLLYGTGGTPASWPELSCGIAYRVSYDIPIDVNVPRDTEDDAFRPDVYLTNRM